MTKAIALLALAGLSFGILLSVDAITHVERYEEVRVVDPWSEKGTFTYAPLLADGSGELEMGEPGYFTTEAPRVRVAFEWALDDAGAERVTALGALRLVVHHDASRGRAAWTHTEEIANATHQGGSGDPFVLTGQIDLPAIAERIAETPGRRDDDTTWKLLATVRFASTPVLSHAADSSEFVLPFTYTPPLYTVPEQASTSKDHSQRQVTTHEDRAGFSALMHAPMGPLLLVASVVAVVPTSSALFRDDEVTA